MSARAVQVAATTAGRETSSLPTTDTLNKYCVTCHNGRLKTAGLQLDSLDVDHVADQRAAVGKDRHEASHRRDAAAGPAAAGRRHLSRGRGSAGTSARCGGGREAASGPRARASAEPQRIRQRHPRPARARDRWHAPLLSSDEADQEGFDNVASVLSVSPALLENYLSAARTISRLAVGDPALPSGRSTPSRSPRRWCRTSGSSDDLPFGSQGGALIRYHFPLDAEYTIKVLLRRQEYDYIIGMGEPHQLDFRLDGVRLKRFTVGGEAKGMTTPENFAGNTQGDPEFEEYMHTADAHLEVRVPVKAGLHEVGVSFVGGSGNPKACCSRRRPVSAARPTSTTTAIRRSRSCRLAVRTARLRRGRLAEPPQGVHLPSRKTPRRRGAVREEDSVDARDARLSAAGRPSSDVQTLLGFYRGGPRRRRASMPASSAGSSASSPRRASSSASSASPPGMAAGSAYRLSDLDLASRLSFFLWSSIPDDELLRRGGSRHAERSGGARAAGAAHAPRSALERARRQLRQPLARAEQAAGRRARHRAVSGVRREPARRDGAGDEAVRRQPAARQPQRGGAADGQLLVSQRAAGDALRDSRTSTATISAASRSPTARAAGCSARRAS